MRIKIVALAVVVFCPFSLTVLGAQNLLEAGEGDYAPPLTIHSSSNTNALNFERYQNYVRVSVVRWYINKQGSFWTDRMASGTCEAKLGEEDYDVALGTYELSNDARTAPVFEKIIVDNRLWVDGNLEIKLFLQAIQKDTVLGGVLKSMAQTSLGIASSTAASHGSQLASGPYAPLVDAGKTLISSVQDILTKGPKPFPIFALENGIDFTIDLRDLHGAVNYILCFRGSKDLLTGGHVSFDEDKTDVLIGGNPLRDGAWVLIKIENRTVYDKRRPWESEAHTLQTSINSLMQFFSLHLITSSNALAKLLPTATETIVPAGSDKKTLGDQFQEVRALIESDDSLSYAERATETGKCFAVWKLAVTACQSNSPAVYTQGSAGLGVGLVSGNVPSDLLVSSAFVDSFRSTISNLKPVSSAITNLTTEQIWFKGHQVHAARVDIGKDDQS
jgi:hypothetical protein